MHVVKESLKIFVGVEPNIKRTTHATSTSMVNCPSPQKNEEWKQNGKKVRIGS